MKTLIVFLFAALLSACQATNAPITQRAWKLSTLYDVDFTSLQKPVTLTLNANQKISGFGGCNSYFGSYEMNGSEIRFTGIGSTKMFCQETMDVENNFFKALQEVQSFKVEDGKLLLMATDKRVVATFTGS
jgi:heat shock protein HslJ